MTIKTFLEPVNCDNLIHVSILFDFYFRLVRLKDWVPVIFSHVIFSSLMPVLINKIWRLFNSGNRRGWVEQTSNVSCQHSHQQNRHGVDTPKTVIIACIPNIWIWSSYLLSYKLELQAQEENDIPLLNTVFHAHISWLHIMYSNLKNCP